MTKLEYGKSPVDPSFWFLEAALYHSGGKGDVRK